MKLTLLILSLIILFSSLVFSQSSKTYVALTNGGKIYGAVEIHTPFFSRSYVSVNDTIKYYIKDIGFVQAADGYYAALGGNLLKRIGEGKLDLYERWENNYSASRPVPSFAPNGTMRWESTYASQKKIGYYSKEGSPLKEVTCSNLEKDLRDNPRSIELLDEYRTLSYVRWGIGIVGAGIVVSSFIGGSKEHPVNKGTLIGGAVMVNLSWIPYLMQGSKLEDAIRIYNSTNK